MSAQALPPDLADAIDALHLLDDESLWRAARTCMPPDRAANLEALHLRRQAGALSEPEINTLQGLMNEYLRSLLVRSKAAALLKQRGYDVSSLPGPHKVKHSIDHPTPGLAASTEKSSPKIPLSSPKTHAFIRFTAHPDFQWTRNKITPLNKPIHSHDTGRLTRTGELK